MKIVAIGDIHGRESWKWIMNQEDADTYVFVADYFDSHDKNLTAEIQMANFLDIIACKKAFGDKMILLIGNHDHHYFPEVGDVSTAGYQHGASTAIGYVLNENRKYLQMCESIGPYLFSHAGISETWMVNNDIESKLAIHITTQINNLWQAKSKYPFLFNGTNAYGDDIGQTPIWIRPRSLMRDSQELKKAGAIQIVGHTQMNKIDIKGKSTGGKYFFIDTLGTSGEYLIIDNGVITSKSIK